MSIITYYTIEAGHIHISPDTNRYLTQIIKGYETQSRGEVIIKVCRLHNVEKLHFLATDREKV